MNGRSLCAGIMVAAVAAGVADAAIVSNLSGEVRLTVSGSTQPLPDPSASLDEAVVYGTSTLREVNLPGGGSAAVNYFLRDTPGGAAFSICTETSLNLAAPPGSSSSIAEFELTFTTIADLRYEFAATALRPHYEATLNELEASMFIDPALPEGIGGTMGAAGTWTATGILAPGIHTLHILTTPAGPHGPAELNNGQFTLTLSEDSDVNVNPTPGAAAGGLVLMAVYVLRARPRRGSPRSGGYPVCSRRLT